MIEIIDDRFYWNAKGSFIKDFNKECINTLNFVNYILQLDLTYELEKQKSYNKKIFDKENLKKISYNIQKQDHLSKDLKSIETLFYKNNTFEFKNYKLIIKKISNLIFHTDQI